MKYLLFCIIILFGSSFLHSQNEPWKRPLKICRSTDGITFADISTFQDSSGVPNVIRLPDNRLISIFQWFRQPVGSVTWDRVAVKFSSDSGHSWTEPVPVIVNGLPVNFTRPFDPTLAVTNEGRIRLFFSCGMNMIPDTSVNTYSAVSDDGITYTLENGIRFSLNDRPVLDPAVIRFNNLWHLVNPASMGQTGAYHNVSGDGLNFTRAPDIISNVSHSWIGNFMIKDNTELRFYGSGQMIWYSSSPNGGEWSSYVNTNIQGGDPSVLRISDSDYLMIYTGQPYTTGAENNSITFRNNFILYQNYPNPFNPNTIINYELRFTNYTKLAVYDVRGKIVAILVNEIQHPGNYEIEFSGNNLASGIYFYRMESGEFRDIKRMVLIK